MSVNPLKTGFNQFSGRILDRFFGSVPHRLDLDRFGPVWTDFFSQTGPQSREMILWTGLLLLSRLKSVDYNFWETNDRFDTIVNLFEVRFLRLLQL